MTGIFELAVIVFVAALLGVFAKFLRQPLILAYIATGIFIGFLGFTGLADKEIFLIFSDLGIMFLLFLVGLEINYTSLRLVGKTSLIIGLGQIVFTSVIGFFIASALGFEMIHSIYIAVALTFSSTIIIVKLLSDKRDFNSLYGKISVGVLLVQDVVAIFILIFLSGIQVGSEVMWVDMGVTVLKGVILFALVLWFGRRVLQSLFNKVAHSRELLFLMTLTWVFLVAAAANKLGFSVEIAGLLAGLALANSVEHHQIAVKVRPLRDFFILIFFVILGSSVVISNFGGLTIPVIIFSLFVLIGNPIIVLVIMGLMGYRKRTSFMVGITVAQISEFSLILVALGLKIGHLNDGILALVTAVGVITITVSTYIITHAEFIVPKISGLLSIFERKNTKEIKFHNKEYKKPIVLIGCHRTGESILLSLPKDDVLVVDFDPNIMHRLEKRGYDFIFGDIDDEEIFEKSGIEHANLIISTSPHLNDNLFIIDRLKNKKDSDLHRKIIVRAEDERDARSLYEAGADYVILPHFTSGQYLGKTIAINPQMPILDDLKENDLKLLRRAKA